MPRVVLMVGTRKGAFFYESDEHRRQWRMRGPYFKGWEVGYLQADPRHGNRLWAAVGSYVYGPNLQVSDDLGETWKQIEAGPAYEGDSGRKLNRIWCVEPGPVDQPEVLYAGVDEAGLFRSRDGGDSWHEVLGLNEHESRAEWSPGAGGLCCHTVVQDPENRERLWVGISAVGVFRSDDGGGSWAPKNEGLPIVIEGKEFKDVGTCVHRLALLPGVSGGLVQQNHQGVFRSDDGADSWRRIETGLPSRFGFPMVVHPRDGSFFVIPLESDEYRFAPDGKLAVYRSRDGGESWTRHSEGLPQEGFYSGILRHAMTTDGLESAGIYFGSTGGELFYSADGGETWQTLPGHLPRIQSLQALVLP